MTEITCKCGCGRKKMVRTADVKRGWGLYYSKSCKAKKQGRLPMSKEKRVQCLRDAWGDGRISDEYYAFVMENEYPECMDAEDVHLAAINHIHISETDH
ncbi:MAG: hypothetical protein V7688_12680 [Alcanivorax jadensis]|uniref:hypothetical protein n=1 Tax=Alcanivorax jadensis TaxID=64988 RepID=UPI0030032372